MAAPLVSEPSDCVDLRHLPSAIPNKQAGNNPKKQRKIIILMRINFLVHGKEGVYLAQDSDTEYDGNQEDELYDVYEKWSTNWKRGCRNCRSKASTKKPKLEPHKTVKASTNRRTLKKRQNVQSNAEACKANNEQRLHKRHLQRFGYEIYHRRTDGVDSGTRPTRMTAPHSYVPHKERWRHNGRSEDHPAALRYELKSNDVSDELSRLLVDLQHRDLTPEDYEVLLRLDEKVAPKTVSESTLATFDTLTLESASTLIGELCSICMEVYSESQCVKTLPCQHTFHDSCIDTWLSSASLNCPLDGIAVKS